MTYTNGNFNIFRSNDIHALVEGPNFIEELLIDSQCATNYDWSTKWISCAVITSIEFSFWNIHSVESNTDESQIGFYMKKKKN